MSYKLPIEIDGLKFFNHKEKFDLELGGSLPELTIGYHTFGKLNAERSNVIWVCHALTANSNVSDWWKGLYGVGNVFDPEKYFIICANILGSCYGSTCARSISPVTGKAYGMNFPLVSIRDMARAHDLLRKHLKIESIDLCIGGSCGGHQVLEFAFLHSSVGADKKLIKNIALLVCAARESAWAIGTHEAQRLAIEADPTWTEDNDLGGKNGLRAARGAALLTYRTHRSYNERQTDESDKTENLKASSYVRYQGHKLERRFFAQAYYFLTKSLDTHHIGRGRGTIEKALKELEMPALIISVDSDLLIPPSQQIVLAEHLPNSRFQLINSDYGHDGFLIEFEKIKNAIFGWWKKDKVATPV